MKALTLQIEAVNIVLHSYKPPTPPQIRTFEGSPQLHTQFEFGKIPK